MVHAFDKKTSLKIKFPNYQKSFSVSCDASKKCTPNSEVSVTLPAYKVWRFVFDDRDNDHYDLHNTRIVSNQPVFVVSGNLICKIDDTTVKDSCMSSVTPVEAWGTQYAVPMFFREKTKEAQRIYFRASSTSFPLHYSYFANGKETKQKFETHTAVYQIELFNPTPIFFTSNVSFGLYMFFMHYSTAFDLDITRLVPVEQWSNGLLYVPSEFDGDSDDNLYVLLATTDPAKLTVSNVSWDNIMGRANGISYWSGSIDLSKGVTKIFSRVFPAKCMLYIRRIKQSGFLTYSYDSYQGIINNDSCVPTTPLAGDGVDNDCDGFVDEETENNLDDDNDEKVDEDNEEPYRDGNWGPWTDVCNKTCPNTDFSQPIRIRTCSAGYPSKFGNRCTGESEDCGPGNTSCSQVCPDENVKPDVKCDCQEGCAECREGSPKCTKCKPGFVDSLFCMDPCPFGWKGTGCAEGPRTLKDFKALEPTTRILSSTITTTTTTTQPENVDEVFLILMPVLFIVFIVGLCCLVFVSLRKRKRLRDGDTAQSQQNSLSSKESSAQPEEYTAPAEESPEQLLEDSSASPEEHAETENDQTEAENERRASES